jgi:hypothetical protein
MREQIERRLEELKAEFEAGQKMMADLEQRKVNLEQTLLRISGAIQVLDEVLASEQPMAGAADGAAGGSPEAVVHNGQV